MTQLLGIFLEKTIIQNDTCTPVLTAALFTIARTWKQPKCRSTDEWIKKMWYIYIMEYYSAIKKECDSSSLVFKYRLMIVSAPSPIISTYTPTYLHFSHHLWTNTSCLHPTCSSLHPSPHSYSPPGKLLPMFQGSASMNSTCLYKFFHDFTRSTPSFLTLLLSVLQRQCQQRQKLFFFNKFIHSFIQSVIYLFIYLWLRWVFISARRLSLVVASGGYSSLCCMGFSLWWLLLLQSTGFSSCGTWAR